MTKAMEKKFSTPTSDVKEKVPINAKIFKKDVIEEEKEDEHEEESNTVRIKRVEEDHLVSSEDEKKFEKLNKIAGKYRKDD